MREEHVTVERHAVNRPVDAATMSNLREGVIEVTETAEVPVVSKEARVVEEVVVGKQATERTETVHDTVRRTDVEVEQIAGTTTTTDRRTGAAFGTNAGAYRPQHRGERLPARFKALKAASPAFRRAAMPLTVPALPIRAASWKKRRTRSLATALTIKPVALFKLGR